MYLADIMTVAVNLVGIPAISVPAKDKANNLPVGIQFMAPQRKDKQLLETALAYQEIT
jgi:aspartyl-tRNA(Asn)/glutamyl-tRNA(Gln) amidotransferase subunit A